MAGRAFHHAFYQDSARYAVAGGAALRVLPWLSVAGDYATLIDRAEAERPAWGAGLQLTIPYTPPFCAPGNRTGTPDYLAPELVARKPTDHRVDLYALGVTAFEVFTGHLPWERTPSSEENFRRRLNTPPRNPKGPSLMVPRRGA